MAPEPAPSGSTKAVGIKQEAFHEAEEETMTDEELIAAVRRLDDMHDKVSSATL
jgi:hypothetical protein